MVGGFGSEFRKCSPKITCKPNAELAPGILNGIRKQAGFKNWATPCAQVTGDIIYGVYIAPNEAILLEHGKHGGFPANRVSKVREIIDPTTAE
jgi:hypothetical protein